MRAVNKLFITLATVGTLYISLNLYKQHLVDTNLTIELRLSQAFLDRIAANYDPITLQRFIDWQNLISNNKRLTDPEKLEKVNDFFNQNIEFSDDLILWAEADYWATPIELLLKGAGDCEDFSIAKYFSLLELGMADNKLRITYVKALEFNQAHMVLTYFELPTSIPLVLDNLVTTIAPANERTDLEPVYSFNGSGLWLAKAKGSGQQVGEAGKLNPWADLKRRMLNNPLPDKFE